MGNNYYLDCEWKQQFIIETGTELKKKVTDKKQEFNSIHSLDGNLMISGAEVNTWVVYARKIFRYLRIFLVHP